VTARIEQARAFKIGNFTAISAPEHANRSIRTVAGLIFTAVWLQRTALGAAPIISPNFIKSMILKKIL
jgi:hypothetical protein